MADSSKPPNKRARNATGSRISKSANKADENNKSPTSPSQARALGEPDPPCAACKSLRRKCTKDCIFLPYFRREEPEKFARVHKVFGASNVAKMLQELPVEQREDAVASLEYEAQARVQDPVYGCVGILCILQRQVTTLKAQVTALEGQLGITSAENPGLVGQEEEDAAAEKEANTFSAREMNSINGGLEHAEAIKSEFAGFMDGEEGFIRQELHGNRPQSPYADEQNFLTPEHYSSHGFH